MVGNIDINDSFKGDWRALYVHIDLPSDLSAVIPGSVDVPYWKPGRLVISSDASLDRGCASFGLTPAGHPCKGGALLTINAVPHSMFAEVFGIGQAVDLAVEILEAHPGYREVVLLCDSSSAIRSVLGLDAAPCTDAALIRLCSDVRRRLEELSDRIPVSVKWVKGHNGIQVNERSDQIADFYCKRVLDAVTLCQNIAAQDQDEQLQRQKLNYIEVTDEDIPVESTVTTGLAAVTSATHSHLILLLEEHCPPGDNDKRDLADRLLEKVNMMHVPSVSDQQSVVAALAALRLPESDHSFTDIEDINNLAVICGIQLGASSTTVHAHDSNYAPKRRRIFVGCPPGDADPPPSLLPEQAPILEQLARTLGPAAIGNLFDQCEGKATSRPRAIPMVNGGHSAVIVSSVGANTFPGDTSVSPKCAQLRAETYQQAAASALAARPPAKVRADRLDFGQQPVAARSVGTVLGSEGTGAATPMVRVEENIPGLAIPRSVDDRLAVPQLILFPVFGFRGSGSSDIAFTVALQQLYWEFRFHVKPGWSFETSPEANERHSLLADTPPTEQRGSITQLPGLAKRLRVSKDTLAVWLGGSPCQKISKGVFFQQNGNALIGPHAAPSNLFWLWHEAILEFLHNNLPTDLAIMSEMVEPADPDWIGDLSAVGYPKKVACHKYGGGAIRDRILFVHPDIELPAPPLLSAQSTGQLWDGSYWPIGRTLEQHPPTIRAIMPHLAVKALDGRAQPREREQMSSLRVGTSTGKLLLPSPLIIAQWMGVPQQFANPWLQDTANCNLVIDDIDGDDMAHWDARPNLVRPPPERVSPCRQKRWCKKCGGVVALLGNGWHVGGTSAVLVAVLRSAALAKLGLGPHRPHPFKNYPVHHCTDRNCASATTLDALRLKQRKAREPPPPPLFFV